MNPMVCVQKGSKMGPLHLHLCTCVQRFGEFQAYRLHFEMKTYTGMYKVPQKEWEQDGQFAFIFVGEIYRPTIYDNIHGN